jgi:hypothetical protein
VRVAAGFFLAAGLLEVGLALVDHAGRLSFWPLWEALGRASLSWLLAWGLLQRLKLCRALALVYCLAGVVTYGAVLALALSDAPLRFPPSVVVGSVFQVPSCALLYAYLRSPAAASALSRPLLG